jgi:hypothetical protein
VLISLIFTFLFVYYARFCVSSHCDYIKVLSGHYCSLTKIPLHASCMHDYHYHYHYQVPLRSTLKPIPLDRVLGQGDALKRGTTATVTTRVKTRMTVTMSLIHRGCKRILLSRVLHSWSESIDFLQRWTIRSRMASRRVLLQDTHITINPYSRGFKIMQKHNYSTIGLPITIFIH